MRCFQKSQTYRKEESLNRFVSLSWVLLVFWPLHHASALNSEEIYTINQQRVFQIKIVDKESESKSSLGSGFVVDDEFTVATNYHVIATAVSKPDKYRLVFVRDNGTEGELSLFDIDIVNDLALLKSEASLGEPLIVSELEPKKGARIFALGNPLDLGMTIVPGTYNGLADHSYYERIHFSGSINSGMSGGPVVDAGGDIVGVNVATAGNQVSFLVPANKLVALLNKQEQVDPELPLLERAEAQLTDSQQLLIEKLFAEPWPTDSIGETTVLGEIENLVSCWGRSSRDEEKKTLIEVSKGCSLQDSIFVNRQMTTGSFEYEFYWIEANGVDERKFLHHLSKSMGGFPGNRAREKDVSEFVCNEGFTNTHKTQEHKHGFARTVYCARRYKSFASLYDVFYLKLAKRKGKAFVSHFTLAGVTQESANTFANAFTEHVVWP